MNLFGWKRKKKEPSIVRVELVEAGFCAIKDDGSFEEIVWGELSQVFAYKVDCYLYDNIWIGFRKQDNEGVLQLCEDVEGFEHLLLAMNFALLGIDAEWYPKIMIPAFEENFTVLFSKQPFSN